MECPGCGVEVPATQKFCHECGTALTEVEADTTASTSDDITTEMAEPTLPSIADQDTVQLAHTTASEPTPATDSDPAPDGDATTRAELPTEEIQPREPLPDPDWAAPTATGAVTGTPDTDPATTTDEHDEVAAEAVLVREASPVTVSTTPTDEVAVASPTTDEMPALFDGSDDLAEYPLPREPFKLRLVFVLAIFGAIATLMAGVADIIDIRTTRPTAGITTGIATLADFGSNLPIAGFIGAGVMVGGGLVACFGLRWGAGLAGGAGLALVGWAALSIGMAEFPIAQAESITRTSSEAFTLRVTRDLGWWLIVGVGAVGFLVFVASLRSFGTGRRPGLNPWLAAVTAVATVILAAGPLIPEGSASLADNYSSPDPAFDMPTAYFAGRLAQVGLIVFAGVIGMLIVRSYGLGLAAGGVTVAAWLWLSSLGEFGDDPIGIADRNPGATDTVPNAVTTVGMVLSIVLLLAAAAAATVKQHRVESH